MKTLPSCLCILGFASASLGGAGTILLDNIGPADGSNMYGGYGGANQIFEASFAAYDIGTLETFDNPDGLGATGVQAVVSGWTGTPYAGPDGIEGWVVSFYSGAGTGGAYCSSLLGDVAAYSLPVTEVVYLVDFAVNAQDATMNSFLVTPNLGGGNSLPAGLNTVGVMPMNPFGTNGQMLITQVGAAGISQDPDSISANPLDGFGGGPCSDNLGLAVALRVYGGTPDPCGSALPEICPADISGPVDEPDGYVNVSDLLGVIANWNAIGDGSFRPVGDCAPLPNGDCEVNVSDLLAVIGGWGSDCIAKGACCYSDGSCIEDVAEADCSGSWLGNASTCGECMSGACCAADGSCSQATAEGCAGNYQGDGTDCATIPPCDSAPANNTCATATVATDGENSVTTIGATTDGPADFTVCDNFGVEQNYNDVYFTYTASCEGIVTVTLCNSVDFDSRLQIYSDCTFADQIGCNDDALSGSCGLTSEINFGGAAGEEYIIRIGGYADGGTGSGTFIVGCEEYAPGACCLGTDLCQEVPDQLSCEGFGGTWQGNGSICIEVDCDPTPANNACADATPAVEGTNAFDTSYASPSEEDPSDALCADTFLAWAGSPDVWFSFIPGADGTLTLDTCDAGSYDTSMVLYEGDCASKVQVACNGDGAGFDGCQAYYSSIINHPVTGGNIYLIRLGGYNAATGPGLLTVTYVDASAVGACCVNDGTCAGDDLTYGQCVTTLGGLWSEGDLCIDVSCPQPYVGCDSTDLESDLVGTNGYACVCPTDGFNTDVDDCNGGANQAVPSYTAYTLGSSVCGEASVYVDGPTGGTYRDLDWWSNTEIAVGGMMTLSIGSDAPKYCLIYDLVSTLNGGYINEAGYISVGDFDAPAGDNVVLTGPIDWDTAWSCGTGLETYTFSVDFVAP